MSAEAVLFLIRYVLIPAAVIGGIFGTGWHYGSALTQRNCNQVVAEIREKSDRLIVESLQREKALTAKAQQVNQIIEEQANVHNTQISTLAESNRSLLFKRVQRDTQKSDCRSNRLPTSAGTTNSSAVSAHTGKIILSEDQGLAIVRAGEEADKLNESLKACRAYLKTLRGGNVPSTQK